MTEKVDQQIVKAVRIGDDWIVTHVGGEALKGTLDALPTLTDYSEYVAGRGYAPLTPLDHTFNRVSQREAESGVGFIFHKAGEPTEADRALALAKPIPPKPLVIPEGHIADPRMKKGYRPDESAEQPLKLRQVPKVEDESAKRQLQKRLRSSF